MSAADLATQSYDINKTMDNTKIESKKLMASSSSKIDFLVEGQSTYPRKFIKV